METQIGVYAAISAVQKEMAEIGMKKVQENKFDHYKFRGIDDVYNALAPVLAKHSLCILPRMLSRVCDERVSKKGDPMFYVTVDAEFDFVAASDGSKHTVKTFGEAMDRSDKATNKAMSAAYKYACFQAFCIPTEGDNDADASTPTVSGNKPKPVPPKKKTPQNEFLTTMRGYYTTLGKDLFEEVLAEQKVKSVKDVTDKATQTKLAEAMEFLKSSMEPKDAA